eukprot:scaffold4361_cov341-Prasinococcus_capsulatus_cf.AAC.5
MDGRGTAGVGGALPPQARCGVAAWGAARRGARAQSTRGASAWRAAATTNDAHARGRGAAQPAVQVM